jgi:hypothetical protein
MGHSAYDPGIDERPPWNLGRKLGAKRALQPVVGQFEIRESLDDQAASYL